MMALLGHDRKSRLKRSGLIAGLVSALCVFGFFFGANIYGERTITVGGVFWPVVVSFPLLLLTGISYYYPMVGGWIFILIAILWMIVTASMLFNTNTPFFGLLQIIIGGLPCLTSGTLLVMSEIAQNRE